MIIIDRLNKETGATHDQILEQPIVKTFNQELFYRDRDKVKAYYERIRR